MTTEQQATLYAPPAKNQGFSLNPGEYLGLGTALLGCVASIAFVPGLLGPLCCIVILVAALIVFVAPIGPGGERISPLIPSFFSYVARYMTGQLHVNYRKPDGLVITDYDNTDQPLPRFIGRVTLSSFRAGERLVGVLVDSSENFWPWSVRYNITLRIASKSQFVLDDPAQQDLLMGQWRRLQELLGNGKNGVSRFSLMPFFLRSQPNATQHFIADSQLAHPESPEATRLRALQALLHTYDTDRRYYVTIQTGGSLKSWRMARKLARGRVGFEALLGAEIEELSAALEHAHLNLVEVLGPQALGILCKRELDYDAGASIGYLETLPEGEVCGPIWHIGNITDSWSHVVIDNTYAASFQIVGWPQRPVGADFLTPLLVLSGVSYRLTVSFQATDPRKTELLTRMEVTSSETAIEEREAKGRVVSAKLRQKAQQATDRDEEFAQGHIRFAILGMVTVVAPSLDELKTQMAVLRSAAELRRIVLHGCYGWQRDALSHTMPLCRGI